MLSSDELRPRWQPEEHKRPAEMQPAEFPSDGTFMNSRALCNEDLSHWRRTCRILQSLVAPDQPRVHFLCHSFVSFAQSSSTTFFFVNLTHEAGILRSSSIALFQARIARRISRSSTSIWRVLLNFERFIFSSLWSKVEWFKRLLRSSFDPRTILKFSIYNSALNAVLTLWSLDCVRFPYVYYDKCWLIPTH